MGCLTGFAKYILFLFNLLILVCGILIIIFGALQLDKEGFGKESFTKLSVSNFALAVGVLISLIAFFGCCGAIKGSSCLLTTYAVIMIIFFILQVVLGILAFVAIKHEDRDFDNEIKKFVEEAYNNITDDDTKFFNDFQEANHCCGADGPKGDICDKLRTCYINNTTRGPCDATNSNVIHTPCWVKFKDLLDSSMKIIGGIAIGFAVVELIGAIFAFCVRNDIRGREYV